MVRARSLWRSWKRHDFQGHRENAFALASFVVVNAVTSKRASEQGDLETEQRTTKAYEESSIANYNYQQLESATHRHDG
jgi:hypothetical protein